MNDNVTKPTRETMPATARIAFDLTPAMAAEVDRIQSVTGLGSKPEVFRRAFTLLRIHVDAALRGREIYMVDPDRPNEKYFIALPFDVQRQSTATEE
jgi:hypothetical protein